MEGDSDSDSDFTSGDESSEDEDQDPDRRDKRRAWRSAWRAWRGEPLSRPPPNTHPPWHGVLGPDATGLPELGQGI